MFFFFYFSANMAFLTDHNVFNTPIPTNNIIPLTSDYKDYQFNKILSKNSIKYGEFRHSTRFALGGQNRTFIALPVSAC